MNDRPPKFFHQFLRWFCHPELLKPIEGDLLELYEERHKELGKRKADQMFKKEVLMLFRKNLIKPLSGTNRLNHYGMFKNHLKVSFRNLIKQKGYTAINIFGLTTSMAITMLIILFIIDQDRQDEYNPNAANIYRVNTLVRDDAKGSDQRLGTSPYEFQELIRLNIESIEESAQLSKTSGAIKHQEDEIQFTGLYASTNFLNFFHLNLEVGNQHYALDQNGIIISREMATKLYGKESPIGNRITIMDVGDFIVNGVIDKNAYKTHLSFDVVLPIGSFTNKLENKMLLSDWEESAKVFYNYFRLQDGASVESLNTYLAKIDSKISEPRRSNYGFQSQRLSDINLGALVRNEIGTTTPGFVGYFFGVLGMVLIISASFNYMNMAIARGLKRAREVGIRKVMGANRKHVIAQFLIEAQLVIFISLIAAFALLQLLVPIFNSLKILRDIDGAITMNFNGNLMVYIAFITFAFIVGFVSGAYPAFYLSSFKSLSVLKGTGGSKKSPSFLFRKVLVFFQYSFSVIFIVTAIILYKQAQIFINTDYGFDYANIINVPLKKSIPYEVFRTELLKKSEVAGVSAVSNLPGTSFFKEVELISRLEEETRIKSSVLSIDPHVVDNLGFEIIAGSNFSLHSQMEKDHVLINEKALMAFGYSDPVDALNQTIEFYSSEKEEMQIKKKVIGVVKDFKHQFVFRESGPLLITYNPSLLTTINIKLSGVTPKRGAEIVESVWKEFDTIHPMNYETYDYGLNDINIEFAELVKIVGLVAFIAILIACLGQFSMVIHYVQLKTKEIGIRKVLGSSLGGLIFGLSKSFIWVILIAVALSTPLAVLINVAWTSKVYNAPEVSFVTISLGVGFILILALSTIYFFVSRAVQANPVDSLKYE